MPEAQDSVSVPEFLEEEEEFYQGPIVDRVNLYGDRTLEGEETAVSSRTHMSLLRVDCSSSLQDVEEVTIPMSICRSRLEE